MEKKPYVISGELNLSAYEDVIVPKKLDAFRENLDNDLRAIGKETTWVDGLYLQSGMQKMIESTRLSVVSLDDRYVDNATSYVGISRGVNGMLDDAGYVPRIGYAAIDQQLQRMAEIDKEIILLDDVVYSGEMVSWLAGEMERRGTKVRSVMAGIAIGEAVTRLAQYDIELQSLVTFDSVDDELCERDFALVKGSGRPMKNTAMRALYFDATYGRPAAWASIPEDDADGFGVRNLRRNIPIFQAGVPTDTVGKIYGFKQDGTIQQAINERLEETK